jgi:hypothetical protein
MSAPTTTAERPSTSRVPVLGPLARRACALEVEGGKRRRLLVLIAAYADAGVCDPTADELLARIPAIRDAGKLQGCTRRLIEDGFIARLPRGAGYELFLEGESGVGS